MDGLLLASIAFLTTLFCIIAGFILKLWSDERNSHKNEAINLPTNQPVETRNAQKTTAQDFDEQNEEEIDSDNEVPKFTQRRVQQNDQNEEIKSSEKKMGKKKMAKIQAKAEAKVQREQETKEREERKLREQEVAKQLEEKRLMEEEEECKRKERLKLEKEEREKRQLEEYLKLKDSFNVCEHGFENENDGNDGESSIERFIVFVQEKKVVHVDELASHFHSLKPEAIIAQLNTLLQEKRICGLFDDRGLFTLLAEAELNDVAKFINQRGRITLAELAENSNRLVTLNPSPK